jgi:hypothetical protein
VPAREILVHRRARARRELERFLEHIGAELVFLAQPQQPVEADPQREGNGGHGVGPRQAVVGRRQQLREGRPVDTRRPRQRGSVHTGPVKRLGKPATKDLHRLPAAAWQAFRIFSIHACVIAILLIFHNGLCISVTTPNLATQQIR